LRRCGHWVATLKTDTWLYHPIGHKCLHTEALPQQNKLNFLPRASKILIKTTMPPKKVSKKIPCQNYDKGSSSISNET
jgi:hypothetical protein